MSKPYDATSKELLQSDPAAWAAFFGIRRPADRIELMDSDLSTVSAAADKVLLIKDDPNWLLDVEFLSWCDPGAPRQLLMYSGLLQHRHKVAVASVLVVLAQKADSTAFTGIHTVTPAFGPAWEFRYSVVRLWKMPVGPFLEGPLASCRWRRWPTTPRSACRPSQNRLGNDCAPKTTLQTAIESSQ